MSHAVAGPPIVSRGDADALCDQASAHLEAGRMADCLRVLDKARAAAPDHARVEYLFGVYHMDAGRVPEALMALDASLRLDPTSAKAHNNRGSALQRLGRTAEAEAAFRRALELGPDLAPPYINLGHLLEARGDNAAAIALYDAAIARGLDRALFEQHRAAVARVTTKESPGSWVRATFDNFAPTFEGVLRSLGYRVPEDLAERVMPRLSEPADILDLGCGTGLCGAALAAARKSLTGVDLSPKMLQRTAERKLYDHLHESEVATFVAGCQSGAYDAIVAADVFIYIGELDAIFAHVARVLRTGGLFAFSIEEQDECDYMLLPTGRYAQSDAYVRRLARDSLVVEGDDATTVRMESGHPIRGRLYVLRKP